MDRSVSAFDSAILRALARKGRNFVSLAEDRSWLEEIVNDPGLQLNRMKQRGSLATVGRGRYVVLPPGSSNARQAASLENLLAAAFAGRNDYYLGYLSAIIDHQLTDEHSKVTYVAVFSRDLPKIDELGGSPVHMTRILSEKKHFGVERIRASGKSFYLRSDLERTLLDALDRPRLCDGPETWVRAWSRAFREERVDLARLIAYGERWHGSVGARCAFWLRDLGYASQARLLLKALGAPLTGRRLLDPSHSFGDGPWHRDRETGLVVNMPEKVVAGWMSYEK